MNYYDLLEVSPKASQAVIASAYRALCQRYHPDKNGGDKAASEKMSQINAAYAILSDTQKRKIYDQEMAASGQIDRGNLGNRTDSENISSSAIAHPNSINPSANQTSMRRESAWFKGALILFGFAAVIVGVQGLFKGITSPPRAEILVPNLEPKLDGEEPEFDSEAAWQRAEQLLVGHVYPQNFKEAFSEYFSISKNNGFMDGRAEQRIAEMYFYGLGVKVDYTKARIWFEKASERFARSASLFYLGLIFERGLPGTTADPVRAYHFFNRAQATLDPDIPANPLISEKRTQLLDGAYSFSDAAGQRKKRLEKMLTLEQINQAQNFGSE